MVTSGRSITITFSGSVQFSQEFEAADSSLGSGQNQLVNLSSGANTITPPSSAVAVTIIPPAGNLIVITLKGVTGDTGIPIHLTDPTSLGLNAVTTFCLTGASAVTGVRLIYS